MQPLPQGDSVPLGGLLGLPRGVERDGLAHLADLEEAGAEVGDGPRAHRPRDGAGVPVLLAVDDHHGVAVDVLLVFGHAIFGHQGLDAVLPRTDPRAAAVDPRPVWEDLGEGTTPDPVPRLEQGHRTARLFQPQGGGQSCETRSHNTKVDIGRHESPLRFRSSVLVPHACDQVRWPGQLIDGEGGLSSRYAGHRGAESGFAQNMRARKCGFGPAPIASASQQKCGGMRRTRLA